MKRQIKTSNLKKRQTKAKINLKTKTFKNRNGLCLLKRAPLAILSAIVLCGPPGRLSFSSTIAPDVYYATPCLIRCWSNNLEWVPSGTTLGASRGLAVTF